MSENLSSNNQLWGFYGSIRHHADPATAWPFGMRAISDRTGCSATAARDFLDSRHGRHFADDVANGIVKGLDVSHAIEAAIDRWEGGSIDRRLSEATGIPQ